jgi:hypothetical protein
VSDLTSWLDGLGLGKYASVLAENEVDLEVLPALNEQDLEKIGIPLGARKKLLRAIATIESAPAQVPASDLQPPTVTSGEAPQATDSPDAAGLATGERRQLTVLFCDMVGFTELASSLDPEVKVSFVVTRMLVRLPSRVMTVTCFSGWAMASWLSSATRSLTKAPPNVLYTPDLRSSTHCPGLSSRTSDDFTFE